MGRQLPWRTRRNKSIAVAERDVARILMIKATCSGTIRGGSVPSLEPMSTSLVGAVVKPRLPATMVILLGGWIFASGQATMSQLFL